MSFEIKSVFFVLQKLFLSYENYGFSTKNQNLTVHSLHHHCTPFQHAVFATRFERLLIESVPSSSCDRILSIKGFVYFYTAPGSFASTSFVYLHQTRKPGLV